MQFLILIEAHVGFLRGNKPPPTSQMFIMVTRITDDHFPVILNNKQTNTNYGFQKSTNLETSTHAPVFTCFHYGKLGLSSLGVLL